jgi:hypothetical protein
MPAPKVDITGKRFGKLTALEPAGRNADAALRGAVGVTAETRPS